MANEGEESVRISSFTERVLCSSTDLKEQTVMRILSEMGFLKGHVFKAIEALGKDSSISELSNFICSLCCKDNESEPTSHNQVKESHDKGDCEIDDSKVQTLTRILLDMGYSIDRVSQAIEAHGKDMSIFELSQFIEAEATKLKQVNDEVGKDRIERASKERSPLSGLSQNVETQLREMGFHARHVSAAINACGEDSSIDVLSDFIEAQSDFIEAQYGSPAVEYAGSTPQDLQSDVCEVNRNTRREYGISQQHPMREGTLPGTVLQQSLSPCIKVEGTSFQQLKQMGFTDESIQRAVHTLGTCDLEVLVDCLLVHEEIVSPSAKAIRNVSGDSCQPRNFCSLRTADVAEGSTSKRLWDDLTDYAFTSSERGYDTVKVSRSVKQTNACQKRPRKTDNNCSISGSFQSYGDMIGYGVPGGPMSIISRNLNPMISGPPYFYFENLTGRAEAWDTTKRHFHGVDPEFVDCKYFSALKRERGYVHNLPVEGRRLIIAPPPMTIKEALPGTRPYWPCWDNREKLTCCISRKAADTLCMEITDILRAYKERDPPLQKQQWILEKCDVWNLIWIGPGQVASVEPHEMELLLGYDPEHTRGAYTLTERYEALANSFQIDTIAYHLSPLCDYYPEGMSVLSLFAGIGGAEVALHKNGVFLKYVVSVEVKEKNRDVIQSWWKRTKQQGRLILLQDVQKLTIDVLSSYMDESGGFDLIVGGCPWTDLSASGTSNSKQTAVQSVLFYEFPRILNMVKQLMHC